MRKVILYTALFCLLCGSCGQPLPNHLTQTFKGLVMEGMNYGQPFGKLFRFEIVQAEKGLVLRVTDRSGKTDISKPEPSDNASSRYLKVSHVSGYTPTEKKQASRTAPPFCRKFTFVPPGEFEVPPESGEAVFTLLDYSISDKNPEKFKWIQFECVITWKEWDRTASSLR